MIHRFRSVLVLGTVAVALTATPATAEDDTVLKRGEQLFRKCIHCHTIEKDGKHRIGPNLFGIFGRKAGAIDDFEFSDAWIKADFIWTAETMDEYLKDPHTMIPGNRMPFDGLSRPEDRAALIAYMLKVLR